MRITQIFKIKNSYNLHNPGKSLRRRRDNSNTRIIISQLKCQVREFATFFHFFLQNAIIIVKYNYIENNYNTADRKRFSSTLNSGF